MRTERVAIRLAGENVGFGAYLTLREPCGHDEMAVAGLDTRTAVELLERLLERNPAARTKPNAVKLSACDRDALLAALHRLCWGDRILSSLNCAACTRPFDLSFELSALQRQLHAQHQPLPPAWRVPTAEDELACVDGGPLSSAADRLANRCGLKANEDLQTLADALEAAAPILDVDLQAQCPECGFDQLAHFDLQSFLLQRLLGERETLLGEIHALASTYGWSLREILGLSRSARRALVNRVTRKGVA